jgi:hypothetical protein
MRSKADAMKDKSFSFYEYAGVIIPGALLIFGILWLYPDLRSTFAPPETTLGDFGIFLIVAYAAGQLLQALGNLLEKIVWSCCGGLPSNCLTKPNQKLLSGAQMVRLAEMLRTRLGLSVTSITGMAPKDWYPITRQIFAEVMAAKGADRVEIFNGNYGLNRGIASGLIAVAVLAIIKDYHAWEVPVGLAAAAGVASYRMHRFGIHYARELFVQFLALPDTKSDAKAK